jgi:acyl dehydratase
MSDLQVGQTARVERTFTQEDFDRFAVLSGDDNPIHVDPEFSAGTKFGRTVAHGMLLYSTVCGAIGSQLPGPGTVQAEQALMFPSATYVDEEVVVQLEVTATHPERGLAELDTVVIRPNGSFGLQGRTLVHLSGAERANGPSSDSVDYPPSPSFKGLAVGQRAHSRRTFTAQDLSEYADLARDANPIFTDAEQALGLGLDGLVVPGGLLGGLFSHLLGTSLPGRGTNYLKQRLEFPRLAYCGQELEASVEIVRIRPDKQLVNLSTTCTNTSGETICRGEALVLISDLQAD